MGMDFLDLAMRVEDKLGFRVPWENWQRFDTLYTGDATAGGLSDFIESLVAKPLHQHLEMAPVGPP